MSVNYGIMRMKKITNLGAMQGIANHNFRKKIDMKSLQHIGEKNIITYIGSGSYTTDFEEAKKLHTIDGKLPQIQKNCCYGWDIVLTATSLNGVDLKEWVEKNMLWLGKTFGVKNVRSLVLHADEKTPHLHGYITPFHYSEKLQRYVLGVKHWTGGFAKMRQLQDSYYESVSSHFGFARGVPVEESKAKHIQPSEYRISNQNKNRDFLKWFNGLDNNGRRNWILKARSKLEQLDENAYNYKYYKSKLEEIKKANPLLLCGIRELLGNSNEHIFDIKQPFDIYTTSYPGKGMTYHIKNANNINAITKTAFSLGALFGAILTTGSDKQLNNNMTLIDFYMRVCNLDFEQAQIVASNPESEMAKEIMSNVISK